VVRASRTVYFFALVAASGCAAHSSAYLTDRDRLIAWGLREDPELAADLALYDPREDYSIYDQYLTRCMDSAYTMRRNVARVAGEGIEEKSDILWVQRAQCIERCQHIENAHGETGYAASAEIERQLAAKYRVRCLADYEAYGSAKAIYAARLALKNAQACVERPECPYLASTLEDAAQALDAWRKSGTSPAELEQAAAQAEKIRAAGAEKLAKIAAYESDPRVAPLRRQIRLLDMEIESLEKMYEPYQLENNTRYRELTRSRAEAARELAVIRKPFGFGDTLGTF
jgi:hypothetical protein